MSTKFETIKFTDSGTGTVTYGTCPVQALSHWLAKDGYEQATAEEAVAAARAKATGKPGPSEEDLANGLVIDEPGGNAVKTSDDVPPADVKDPTAGDDAESKDDNKPGRAGRRPS